MPARKAVLQNLASPRPQAGVASLLRAVGVSAVQIAPGVLAVRRDPEGHCSPLAPSMTPSLLSAGCDFR